MIVEKHGFVRVEKGNIAVEGWMVKREASDPVDATEEQMLLHYAAKWALARLQEAVTQAALDVIRAQQRSKNSN